MALRRGFKSEANSIAREVRDELGLIPYDALDPWVLAEHLGIPVSPLSSLRAEAPSATHHLGAIEAGAFSAATVFCGTSRTIVHNDSHVRGRQASDIAHELSHALLQHPPAPALDDRGCRDWNQDIEDEAEWLAGALLITDEAALWIVRRGLSEGSAATRFGVTQPMVRYRINVTGARKRIARARRLPAV